MSFSFGAPQTAANTTGFAFGASNTTIGTQQQTQPAPAFGLSAASSAPAATTSAPTLNFGLGSATTSAPTGGLTFGLSAAPTTAQSSAPPAFGGFGLNTSSALGSQAKTTGVGIGFGLTTTTTASIAPINNTLKLGLGGVDINAAQPKTIEGQVDSSKVKENQLPQEIIATVDSLKAYTNQQKTISSDIVRASARKITNINSELAKLNWALAEIHSNVENNFSAIKQLRTETNKARQDAEKAQRTQETPSGLQFENTAPLYYFMDLVKKFESDMLTIRKQLELTETHIRSLTNPQAFTADDMKKGLQQIHECFVALAGRLQETHRAVEIQNEQFLNLMKHRGRDRAIENIYDGASSNADIAQPMIQQIASGCRAIIPNVACGPTPFSSFPTDPPTSGISSGFNVTNNSSAFGSNQNTTGFGATGSMFGDFNLNKPSIGSKRAK